MLWTFASTGSPAFSVSTIFPWLPTQVLHDRCRQSHAAASRQPRARRRTSWDRGAVGPEAMTSSGGGSPSTSARMSTKTGEGEAARDKVAALEPLDVLARC